LIRQYAFDYTNQHRSELESQELANFISLFEINTNDFNLLADYCRTAGVIIPVSELSDYDKSILSTQLKAYIARNIWNDDGFFPVIHKIDYTFQQAILQ
jgi:carboxyl-terminal processing protease